MKTTVELPVELFRRAKATAASQGISLKRLFSEALEDRLRRDQVGPITPAWRKLFGGLSSLRKETRRITRLMEEEFGRVDEA